MVLYLVRHGEAHTETEDPRRDLTGRGFSTVQTVAMDFSLMNPDVRWILHSDKLRARRTAELLADVLKTPERLQESPHLSPDADPGRIAAQLEKLGGGTVLVGHLPHLSRLVSLLVTGSPEQELIHLQPAGIVCLRRYGRSGDELRWRIEWMIRPVLVEAT